MQLDWSRPNWEAVCAARANQSNIRLSVDGARRRNGASAGGLAITAFDPSGEEILLCRGGCLFGTLQSAFEAELLALEWGIEVFTNLMERCTKTGSEGTNNLICIA